MTPRMLRRYVWHYFTVAFDDLGFHNLGTIYACHDGKPVFNVTAGPWIYN